MSRLLETQSPLILGDDKPTLLNDLLSECVEDSSTQEKISTLYMQLQEAIRSADEQRIKAVFCKLSKRINPTVLLDHCLAQIRQIWQQEERKSIDVSEAKEGDTINL